LTTRFPKSRPPANKTALERWVFDKATEDGVVVDRVRRGISFMVVSAVLARLTDEGGIPLFLVKGGVSMQLRFGIRARPSKDYDTAFRQDLSKLEVVLAQAPAHPIGPFRVTAGAPESIGPTAAVRIDLTIRFGTKPWGTVPLEVSPAEGSSGVPETIDYVRAAPDLWVFGLEPVGDVPCLPVPYQIAQKLHACTEVLEHKENDRFRDLLDLLLLGELVGDDEWPRVRAACEEVFTLRSRHQWPPQVIVFPGWPDAFAALAREAAFATQDVARAAGLVNAMVKRIAEAA
jgi:Nucleotidyl transferase AbiEii toxin, Type IV TA system